MVSQDGKPHHCLGISCQEPHWPGSILCPVPAGRPQEFIFNIKTDLEMFVKKKCIYDIKAAGHTHLETSRSERTVYSHKHFPPPLSMVTNSTSINSFLQSFLSISLLLTALCTRLSFGPLSSSHITPGRLLISYEFSASAYACF